MSKRRFMIDVEVETQENAVFLGNKFICFEDDADKMVEVMNILYKEVQQLQKENDVQLDVINDLQEYICNGGGILNE